MRKTIFIDISYLIVLVMLTTILMGVYAINGPMFWDVFDNYKNEVTIFWLITTILYNLYVTKFSSLKTSSFLSTNNRLVIPIIILILMTLSWFWQKVFYENYIGSTFLIFHPGLIITIILFFIYTLISFYIVINRLKLAMTNR